MPGPPTAAPALTGLVCAAIATPPYSLAREERSPGIEVTGVVLTALPAPINLARQAPSPYFLGASVDAVAVESVAANADGGALQALALQFSLLHRGQAFPFFLSSPLGFLAWSLPHHLYHLFHSYLCPYLSLFRPQRSHCACARATASVLALLRA